MIDAAVPDRVISHREGQLMAVAAAMNWRDAVQSVMGAGQCDYNTERTIGALIDSEMQQKAGDSMALMALAGDLQAHRRLPDLPRPVMDLLDKKARGVGKLGKTVMQSGMLSTLFNSLGRR
eukprot:TRINITY_DN115492_c0_g1_i1.p2 TRINITY_DN115492_c0_g1~~TRINITY_DN115492_c0_g1_i1.p2  ORF type:complete len:121 (-),score=18.55 TRINITY_DN115492_c0_g1_i1:152-514(-)